MNLQIFKNEQFGEIRSLEKNGEVLFVAADVCKALGLTNPTMSMQQLEEDERAKLNLGRQGKTNVVNEYGLYNLVLSSRKPEAKAFKRWITHEVIPAIRKTGSYSIHKEPTMREQAMLNNSLCRKAALLLRCSKETGLPVWKELLVRGAANLVAGEELIPPPKVEKLYSATEIAKMNNISSNKVGRIANLLGLKTDEYGCYCHDVAKHCNREVEIFMYNQKALALIEGYLRSKGGAA